MNIKVTDTILSIVQNLRLPLGSKILDVGCSTGTIANMLAVEGYMVRGIDISAGNIEIAKRKNNVSNNLQFLVGNAEDLEFGDAQFDLVLVIGALEFILWQRWAFQEIKRVLKPGGYLFVVSANRMKLINLINPQWYFDEIKDKLKNRVAFSCKPPPEFDNEESPTVAFSSSKLSRISPFTAQLGSRINQNLQLSGYQILIQDSIGFGPIYKIKKNNNIQSNFCNWRSFNHDSKITTTPKLLGNELIFVAQKSIKPSGISHNLFFKNIAASISQFEMDKKSLFDKRNNWLRNNQNYLNRKPENIDTIIGDRKRILIISPHPDDEIIGCGGTIIKILNQGKQVTVLHLTDGRNTAAFNNVDDIVRSTARLEEAQIVADFIGLSELILWKIPDNEIKIDDLNKLKLTELLERIKPEIIFTPFVNDPHPDHQDANKLLSEILQKNQIEFDNLIILGYECWSILPQNVVSPITDEFEKKTNALMKYKIAMRVVDYVTFCENLNAYHHCINFNNPGYAEAFFSTNVKTFIELLKSQDQNNNING